MRVFWTGNETYLTPSPALSNLFTTLSEARPRRRSDHDVQFRRIDILRFSAVDRWPAPFATERAYFFAFVGNRLNGTDTDRCGEKVRATIPGCELGI